MFNFAKKRIDEIVKLVTKNFQINNSTKTAKVTKLDNESKATTDM